MAKKIELLHTTYDESGNIESQEVVHPLTSPDCIVMENGKTLDEVMGDGIATPTLTHEGTSFKVGVGDSNIEVVDGDVAGMTLKGQSYQNILPKPTTLIMETDEQEFKINDKIDSNIIIDDNIAEIATIKGKTIVNTVQEESGSEYTVLGEDLSGQSIAHVKETPTLQGQTLVNLNEVTIEDSSYQAFKDGWQTITTRKQNYNMWETGDVSLFKTNTQYLVIIEVEQNTISYDFDLLVGHSTCVFSLGETTGKTHYKSGEVGRKVLTLTTKNNFDGVTCVQRFATDNQLSVSNETVTYHMMFIEYQEGMENWDIPYFEGEKYFEYNIKGVTLQGQTLVNTIQEPCRDDYVVLGADDGIEISAETGGHGTIEDTVQGGINGAVLEGNTLVNILKSFANYSYSESEIGIKWIIGGGASLTETLNNDELTMTLTSKGSKIVRIDDVSMIKPNTKYMVKINYTTSFENGIDFGWLDNSAFYTPIADIKSNEYAIFTTPSDLSTWRGLWFGILGDLQIGDTIKISKPVLIEYQDGMENWSIPYFEGMASVKQPILTTVGKNLINIALYDKECYNELSPNEYELVKDYHNKMTPVNILSRPIYQPTVLTYTAKTTDVNKPIHIKVEYTDGTVEYSSVPTLEYSSRQWSITKPIRSVRIVGGVNGTTTWYIKNLQLEEGSVATSYEPYQSSTVTTSKIQLTEAMLEQGSVDEKKPVGTLYINMKNTSESAEYYTTRIRTVGTYKVKPNTDYQLKLNSNYRSFIVCFNDGKYMSHITWNTQGTRTFTVPSNCNEIALVFCLVNGASISVSEFLNVGVELAEALTLRAIGDVKDELDLQTGKLTQRIGEVVLDGSEDWEIHESYTNEYRINFVLNRGEIPSNCKFICNQYATTTLRQEDTLTDYMYVGNLNINVFTKPNTTLDEFKLQLQSNPLILQYPLATPIVKTIDLQVTDQDGNTIPHIQTQPTVTHITASSDYLIPTVTIDNNLAYETIIKPSTLYTIRLKHDTVNTDNPLTVDLGGTVQVVTSTEFTITTPSTLTHNQLVFSGKNNVVSEVQVIEGDVTSIEYPFFEGMGDVKFSDSKFVVRNCPFIFGKGGRL